MFAASHPLPPSPPPPTAHSPRRKNKKVRVSCEGVPRRMRATASHTNTAHVHLWGFSWPSNQTSPAFGRRCLVGRLTEGPEVGEVGFTCLGVQDCSGRGCWEEEGGGCSGEGCSGEGVQGGVQGGFRGRCSCSGGGVQGEVFMFRERCSGGGVQGWVGGQ